MNVGDVKGKVLDSELQAAVQRGAKTFLEIGAYCGYSAVRISSQLPPGCVLYSMEVNAGYAAIARELVHHAGLKDMVQFLIGDVEAGVKVLKERGVTCIDWVLIDHWKDLYVKDFLHLRSQGLLPKGSTVVADNLLCPGAPDYRELMKEHPNDYAYREHDTELEYSDKADIVGVSIMLT